MAKEQNNQTHGYEALWTWFGLSYSSWLTLPRVLMHEMPDEWQQKMADLLQEWDDTWTNADIGTTYITMRKNGKFIKVPDWLNNYRHPQYMDIDKAR